MLNNEELNAFEEELKQFLIVNGVHAEEWEAMNKKNPEKAVELVELFSDTVLQRVYEKINFLEFRSEESCIVFHCTKEQIELIAINRKEGTKVDLSTPESIHKAIIEEPEALTFFKSKKEYSTSREGEIHKMIEDGCFLSSVEFWNLLNKL